MKNLLIVSLLITYFLFTSGLVFEASGSTNIDHLDIPYSLALSAERTGVTPLTTQDDIDCMKWLRKNWNGKYQVIGDYNTFVLITANTEILYRLNLNRRKGSLIDILDECYIFISSWNTRHKQYIESVGTGIRKAYPLPEFNYPVVYQSGNALIYLKEKPVPK